MEEQENALPLEQEQINTPGVAPQPIDNENGADSDNESDITNHDQNGQDVGHDVGHDEDQDTGQEGGQDGGQEEHHPDPDPTIAPICLGIVGTVYKGEYDESVSYKDRWQTTYDGSTYIAMRDDPDKPPFPDGKNWIITAKGYPEAHYVRFIKGEASEDWYEGEVILTKADFDLDHVENLSLDEILEHCVTGISVNHDPVRRGELNIDIVNTLSINGGEPMVGEVNVDCFTALTLNGNELPLDKGATDIRAIESLLVNEHIEVVNQEGVAHLSLSEGLVINDIEIAKSDYKQNIALTFNGEPLKVVPDEGISRIDLPLSINNKPIEENNFTAVQSISINKKGPLVMIDGNVDIPAIEGIRMNSIRLPQDEFNILDFCLYLNGKPLKFDKEAEVPSFDIEAITGIEVNGEKLLVEDGVARLVLNPTSITLNGICFTESENPDKTVDIEEEFELKKGKRIEVIFTQTNSAENITMNVNDSGAIPVYIKGKPVSKGMANSFQAGGSYSLLYDGNVYQYLAGSTPLHDIRDVSISAENWQEQSADDYLFYTFDIEVEGLEADDYVNLRLSDTTNLPLVNDYKRSGVWAYEQSEGKLTLAAENRPTLNWPMSVEITQ